MTVKTVGLDLAKDVFQVHGISESGRVIFNKAIKRAKFLAFFEALAPCMVGMEACGSAHHWGRTLRKFGHDVRLMPANYVKPYVKRGKTDAADAEAICEAVRRPTMRFVETKTEDQQAVILDLHSRRVIGWAVSNRMKRDLAIRAMNMAIALRRPPKGCIHHTDRGSQYCSHDYQKLMRQHGFKVSMSGKGNCYDCEYGIAA